MSVRLLVEDSWSLYKRRRYHSAFCLAIVAIEGAASLRYGRKSTKHIKSSAQRFRTFVNEETTMRNLLRMKHAVDMPPPPEVGARPVLALSDNCENLAEEFSRWKNECEKRQAEDDRAFAEYSDQFIDAGDDFCGPRESYIGKPRLVTTTGILYQARCEMIHEGGLSSIRLTAREDDSMLSVSGADPIEFSSTWVKQALGIVTGAKENEGMFEEQGQARVPHPSRVGD